MSAEGSLSASAYEPRRMHTVLHLHLRLPSAPSSSPVQVQIKEQGARSKEQGTRSGQDHRGRRLVPASCGWGWGFHLSRLVFLIYLSRSRRSWQHRTDQGKQGSRIAGQQGSRVGSVLCPESTHEKAWHVTLRSDNIVQATQLRDRDTLLWS